MESPVMKLKKKPTILKDLDSFDSDSEVGSDRNGGFLFKDTYFEDSDVENLITESDSNSWCTKCQYEFHYMDPIQSESYKSSDEKTKSGKKEQSDKTP